MLWGVMNSNNQTTKMLWDAFASVGRLSFTKTIYGFSLGHTRKLGRSDWSCEGRKQQLTLPHSHDTCHLSVSMSVCENMGSLFQNLIQDVTMVPRYLPIICYSCHKTALTQKYSWWRLIPSWGLILYLYMELNNQQCPNGGLRRLRPVIPSLSYIVHMIPVDVFLRTYLFLESWDECLECIKQKNQQTR